MTGQGWPSQPMFPGQAAAPDGPVDGLGMYLMHHGFRRDLGRFATAAARTPVSDRSTWRALARRWTSFTTNLHHHHTAEDDGLWPEVLRRTRAAGDDEATATLLAMSDEHDELSGALDSCTPGFAGMARAPDAAVRTALVADLETLRDVVDRHLAHEERSAMAILQRYLDAASAERLEKEAVSKAYPATALFGLLPWAADEVPADLRARFLASGGPVVRMLLPALRIPYAWSCRRAFRYVTATSAA